MSEKNGTSKLYFGGLPTGPDVRKLEAAFPNIRDLRGTTINHEDLEVALGMRRDSSRYRTVVHVWAKQVRRSTGVVIRGDLVEVKGIGYRVLSDAEQVKFGVTERRGAGRKIVSSHTAFADTDETKLSPEQRRIRDHGLLAGKMIHAAMVESRKFVAQGTAPPEANPRPLPLEAGAA